MRNCWLQQCVPVESAISNLFNYGVQVIASIFWERERLNTPRNRISVEYSSGYLLFNTSIWIHENQGPWFGENFIIAKKPKHIQLGGSLQSSLKINHMLITSCICIKWKSSRFLSPVSTVSAKNTWDHDSPRILNKKKRKRLADYDSPWYATSSNYKIKGLIIMYMYNSCQNDRNNFLYWITLITR